MESSDGMLRHDMPWHDDMECQWMKYRLFAAFLTLLVSLPQKSLQLLKVTQDGPMRRPLEHWSTVLQSMTLRWSHLHQIHRTTMGGSCLKCLVTKVWWCTLDAELTHHFGSVIWVHMILRTPHNVTTTYSTNLLPDQAVLRLHKFTLQLVWVWCGFFWLICLVVKLGIATESSKPSRSKALEIGWSLPDTTWSAYHDISVFFCLSFINDAWA